MCFGRYACIRNFVTAVLTRSGNRLRDNGLALEQLKQQQQQKYMID